MPYPKLPLKAEPTIRLSRPRWQRRLGIAALSLVLVALGFVGVQAYRLGRGVFVTNTNAQSAAFSLNTKRSPDWNLFQRPGDGRVNILVLGIGGINDAGVAHAGTYLTDSIQLISLDTLNHTVSMTSLPRDLEVKTPDGYGYEKINSVYGGLDGSAKDGGARIKQVASAVLGTRIANFVVVDFTAAKQLVDAVGGIDLVVPAAINDPAYPADDDLGYSPFSIAAGPQHLNGTVALKYMRTRHDDSDFGRSGRQQAVFTAVQEKALSLGVLSNPAKVNQIVTALGSHVKTDLTVDEIGKLVAALKQVDPKSITSNVLDTSDKLGLLISDSDPDLGYVAMPTDGVTSYDAIHNWYQSNTIDPLIPKESATIQIANAGATKATFTAVLTQLTSAGFKATALDAGAEGSTPKTTVTKTTIRVRSKTAKPVTINYLTTILSGTVVVDGNLPAGVDIMIDYLPAKPTAKATTPATTETAPVQTGSSAWNIE